MWWLGREWVLDVQSHSVDSFLSWAWERGKYNKMPMRQDWSNSVGQKWKQRPHIEAGVNKDVILYLPSADDVQSVSGSRALTRVLVALEDRSHPQMSPHFLLSLGFYIWHHMVWNTPLVSSDHLAWPCPFPRSCPRPSLLLWECGSWISTALVLSKPCSAAAKTLVCYQHPYCYHYKRWCYRRCYGDS